MSKKPGIAIFASGSGTNAQRLIEHYKANGRAEVILVACDRPGAGVVQRAWDLDVPVLLFNGEQLASGTVLRLLKNLRVDVVVLAGFLRLMPLEMVQVFHGRMVNIHPALLPAYGGKGMYGERVHKAVLDAGEPRSGITVHLVNERYDEGEILLQVECPVEKADTPRTLAARIHELEHRHYPAAVDKLLERL